MYSPFFHRLLQVLTLIFPRKVIGTSFKYSNQKSCPKRKRQMIQICAFKEKEKEEGEGRPQLGA
jgi:hypothetical protein